MTTPLNRFIIPPHPADYIGPKAIIAISYKNFDDFTTRWEPASTMIGYIVRMTLKQVHFADINASKCTDEIRAQLRNYTPDRPINLYAANRDIDLTEFTVVLKLENIVSAQGTYYIPPPSKTRKRKAKQPK